MVRVWPAAEPSLVEVEHYEEPVGAYGSPGLLVTPLEPVSDLALFIEQSAQHIDCLQQAG